MSRFIFITILAATLMVVSLSPSLAAGGMEGKIHSVDTAEQTITLDNGVKVWLADGVQTGPLKEGVEVLVTYEERDGKPVATNVEVK